MTLVETITKALKDRLARQDQVSMAVSGGSSPIALYQALSAQDLDWARVAITLIDDRRVAPDHADSNQKLIADTLLQGPTKAASFIPLEDWPQSRIPDIGILGMGGDGHFASLFPAMLDDAAFDPAAFDPAASPAIITTPPMGNPLHPRISMNLAMILNIPLRLLMVIGDEKITVLRKAQSGQDYPITRLLAHDGTTITHDKI